MLEPKADALPCELTPQGSREDEEETEEEGGSLYPSSPSETWEVSSTLWGASGAHPRWILRFHCERWLPDTSVSTYDNVAPLMLPRARDRAPLCLPPGDTGGQQIQLACLPCHHVTFLDRCWTDP